MSNKVVLVLDDTRAAALLEIVSQEAERLYSEAIYHTLQYEIRAALQQEREEAVEYCVAGDDPHWETTRRVAVGSLPHARARAQELATGSALVRPWKNVRIQSRQTFTTDWIDLDGEEGKP